MRVTIPVADYFLSRVANQVVGRRNYSLKKGTDFRLQVIADQKPLCPRGEELQHLAKKLLARDRLSNQELYFLGQSGPYLTEPTPDEVKILLRELVEEREYLGPLHVRYLRLAATLRLYLEAYTNVSSFTYEGSLIQKIINVLAGGDWTEPVFSSSGATADAQRARNHGDFGQCPVLPDPGIEKLDEEREY